MKIKKIKNKKNLTIFLLCGAIILAVVAYTTYSINIPQEKWQNRNKEDTSNQPKNKKETTNDNSRQKTPDQKTSTTNSDPQAPVSTDQTTGKTIVSVAASVDVAGDVVYIRGGINNIVSGGVCKVFLKHSSGRTLEKETSILPNASTVDCKTVQIPISELSPGAWTYTLKYLSNTAEGSSSENSFQVN